MATLQHGQCRPADWTFLTSILDPNDGEAGGTVGVIVYQATKSKFLDDNNNRDIADVIESAFVQRTGRYAQPGEFRAWQASLAAMARVLRDDGIPDDVGVGVEFGIPQTAKRIDFILSGQSDTGTPHLIIVELKQWSSSRISDKDGVLLANRGGYAEIEGAHPSYQAWSYAALLNGFNEAIYDTNTELRPCAYLHNYLDDGVIRHPHYEAYLEKAPVFLRGEEELLKLRAFIKRHVRKGDNGDLLYKVENGRIRPSKMLADSLGKMLKGNREFVLVDDQKLVYEACLAKAAQASDARKQVVVVQGGPGTGKSVVAINLLVELTNRAQLAKYVSKNAAPRSVYEQRLKGQKSKAEISAMFGGPWPFVETPPNTFDTLIVDEAHRLNEKSGLYANLGENQIKELISAAKCTTFFVDDDQIVTLNDIGHSKEIEKWAENLGADISRLELESQFRCAGSDGYLAWLDDTLGIRPTANQDFNHGSFDFNVVDSPSELHELISAKNRINNKSRVVAGYCWDWKSKRNPAAFDIEFPEFNFRRQWNLGSDGSLWITAPNSIEQIGCIHTCQGLELDYVGVIIGPDMIASNGTVGTVPDGRSNMDRSVRGWKKMARADREGTLSRVDRIIRNTYRTLMTRGMKGCYIYCTDPELQDYFKQRTSG